MLELKIKAGRQYVDPTALASRFGTARALEELGDMIEYLIAQVDFLAGEPDLECNGDLEPDSDAMGDPSWCEWHTLPAAARKNGSLTAKTLCEWLGSPHEDDEDDDPAGQCDEDGVNTSLRALKAYSGPGCPIGDPDFSVDDRGCDEEGGDCLPVLDWRAQDQTEAIVPPPGVDQRIMGVYRDRIRRASYEKIASPFRGGKPVWRLAGAPLTTINADI